MDLLRRYRELNMSFEKIMVYHVGIDAGFFAEYTYMLDAMLFCLQNKIQFRLYSSDANFKYDKGWTDYFLPFCVDVHETYHSCFNIHRLPSWNVILKQKQWNLLKWKFKSLFKNAVGDMLAFIQYRKRVFLNHNISFNPDCHFFIPELDINGDYLHAFQVMVKITWHLNSEANDVSKRYINKLNLPSKYISCQVRGGDKITETDLLLPQYYIDTIKDMCVEKNVFVLTDDIRIFNTLKQREPDFNWYTLCTDEEYGYVNNTFSLQRGHSKKMQMLRFITSIDLIMKSNLFIGSITTNPSLFMLKLFYPQHNPIDCSKIGFKKIACSSIKERGEISKQYLKY